jgi:hypothetical protein
MQDTTTDTTTDTTASAPAPNVWTRDVLYCDMCHNTVCTCGEPCEHCGDDMCPRSPSDCAAMVAALEDATNAHPGHTHHAELRNGRPFVTCDTASALDTMARDNAAEHMADCMRVDYLPGRGTDMAAFQETLAATMAALAIDGEHTGTCPACEDLPPIPAGTPLSGALAHVQPLPETRATLSRIASDYLVSVDRTRRDDTGREWWDGADYYDGSEWDAHRTAVWNASRAAAVYAVSDHNATPCDTCGRSAVIIRDFDGAAMCGRCS